MDTGQLGLSRALRIDRGLHVYLRLLDAWGPTPAIGYSFVSPAIAVAAGVLVFAEQYTSTEGVGALIMLTATALMVRTVGK